MNNIIKLLLVFFFYETGICAVKLEDVTFVTMNSMGHSTKVHTQTTDQFLPTDRKHSINTPILTEARTKISLQQTMHAESFFAIGNRLLNQDVKYTQFDKETYCKGNLFKEILTYFEKAAELGHAEAQYRLGTFYEEGIGVKHNMDLAIQWWTKAAQQYHAKAQHNLGFCYQQGIGVVKDLSVAIEWFEKAADQGYADSQFNLGCNYIKGIGVAQNPNKAIEWYKKAAQQGHEKANKALKSLSILAL